MYGAVRAIHTPLCAALRAPNPFLERIRKSESKSLGINPVHEKQETN